MFRGKLRRSGRVLPLHRVQRRIFQWCHKALKFPGHSPADSPPKRDWPMVRQPVLKKNLKSFLQQCHSALNICTRRLVELTPDPSNTLCLAHHTWPLDSLNFVAGAVQQQLKFCRNLSRCEVANADSFVTAVGCVIRD